MSAFVAVVGAGAVGARISRRLVAADAGVSLHLHDPEPGVASRLADGLGGRATVAPATVAPATVAANTEGDGVRPDLAVLASPRPHHEIARRYVMDGVPVVSVCDDVNDVRALLELDTLARRHRVPVVVGAAASPGLSGLLARHLADRIDSLDEVHVAVHGTGGPACARQHHRALAGTAVGWQDGAWLERPAGSGRELCWFPDPLGAWDCYRAALADPIVLRRAFPTAQRISARLSANRRDRLTARFPMMSPPHREGGLGGIRVEVRGTGDAARVALVAGVAERTAIVAANVAATFALAVLAGELPYGVIVPGQADLPTAALLRRIAEAGLSLQEFVGTEERTAW